MDLNLLLLIIVSGMAIGLALGLLEEGDRSWLSRSWCISCRWTLIWR